MNTDELLDAIGDVKDAYIDDARNGNKSRGWVRWCALAACIVLIVGIAVRRPPAELPDLPMLTITDDSGAMGYEGYLVYDVSELVNANPWTNRVKQNTLPVFRNPQTYNRAGKLISGDTSKIETIRDNVESCISGADIRVEDGMTVLIEFDPAIRLPETYQFGYHATYDQMENAADYLLTEYGDLIAMKKPTVNIYGGDYDIYGNQMYHISFFDSAGDLTDQIIQYNFSSVTFYPDDEGKLWLVRLKETDLSEKIGDYPIISQEEAEALLRNGKYTTSVPYAIHDDMVVAKVELMYRNRITDQYFIPYYRFIIELPEGAFNGMKQYGAYYVPAVAEQYIENMPLWDGSFNQ